MQGWDWQGVPPSLARDQGMTDKDLLLELGYRDSPNFLRPGTPDLEHAPYYAHVFRKAEKMGGLRGVYTLRPQTGPTPDAIVPVVYVFEVASEEQAGKIHRLVWNQNVVPFVIVKTPNHINLYSGFRYNPEGKSRADRGILEASVAFNQIAQRLEGLYARSIDNGHVWEKWGAEVTPETRVDWKLLDSLETLDQKLRDDDLDKDTSHALIGKYVYLHYLRDRGFLTKTKLARWDIGLDKVFTRNACLDSFKSLIERLDDWLNGSIFPLNGRAEPAFKARHLKLVAGVFSGDDPGSGQLYLDFQAYDFSHIPIETLSVIYQQFLHTPGKDGEQSAGQKTGAYYTPIPLVNFMLAELHERRPLTSGMKVLDPSCGSGAFLVQCYRHLIERQLVKGKGRPLRPTELRELLEKHIFGVERNGDACRVAELSLTLTLLDYIEPPGLANGSFKLPVLRDKNIFKADFFAPASPWTQYATKTKFDWIVGNPPWIEVKGGRITQEDRHVWEWMQDNKQGCPTGGHQVAEAFAWKVASHTAVKGVIGLLLPAMTLFKDESKVFRTKFFQQNRVSCVANFANLRHVLFGEQSVAPAAAVFYSPRKLPCSDEVDLSEEVILTYAPFRANQEANRPSVARKRGKAGKRNRTWNIVVNANEVREVRAASVAGGDMLPWKLAMWGSHRDERLLRRVTNRVPTSLSKFTDDNRLQAHEGPQFRSQRKDGEEPTEPVKGLAGKNRLKTKKLHRCGRIFTFPPRALAPIPPGPVHVRKGRVSLPLSVSRPPHIIVDASRRFAVYSDEFIAVPPRYIGISGSEDKAQLLRALSLYLSSDFVTYHQFLTSPEWGIRAPRTTLHALKELPVPLGALESRDLQRWDKLHASLVAAPADRQASKKNFPLFDGPGVSGKLSCLTAKMNEEVNDLLGLTDSERTLVNDLVSLRVQMNDGHVNEEVLRNPTVEEMGEYLLTLRSELDAFLENQPGLRHELVAVQDERSAMISIDLKTEEKKSIPPRVLDAASPTAKQFAEIRKRLLKKRSQWVYFDRGLRIYEGSRTYLFKPLQRMLWTKSQALMDSDEIIAETLVGEEG